ncbi:hypothetical protein ES705_44110 [subsurface metagenome]
MVRISYQRLTSTLVGTFQDIAVNLALQNGGISTSRYQSYNAFSPSASLAAQPSFVVGGAGISLLKVSEPRWSISITCMNEACSQ